MGLTAELSTGQEGYPQGEGEEAINAEGLEINQWQEGRELLGAKEVCTLLEEGWVGLST